MRCMRALLAIAGCAAACLPDRIDITGKLCSDERPCGEGWACVPQGAERVCVPARGQGGGGGGNGTPGVVMNLLPNGDFTEVEDGSFDEWKAWGGYQLAIETQTVRSAPRAARIVRAGNDAGGGLEPDKELASGPPRGQRYCAAAWVFGVPSAREVWLQFRERDGSGQTVEQSDGARVAVADGWAQVRHEWGSLGNAQLEVRLVVGTGIANAPLYVDDFAAWAAPQGACP